jgi:RNA polymerase sigma-B factor
VIVVMTALPFVRKDGRCVRDRLIESYLPLARRLAMRYRRSPEPFDDLVQVASLGLIKAADRWDPDRGVPFASYAAPTILGELRRYFRDSTWHVRPPRPVQKLRPAIEAARESLTTANGHEPTVADLAARLERPPEDIAEALRAADARRPLSLDTPVQHEEHEPTATIGELLGNDDEGFERAETRVTIEGVTAILDERAREILRLRFEADLIQSEIAERVGCSQMHVSRTLRSSLERLQQHAKAA